LLTRPREPEVPALGSLGRYEERQPIRVGEGVVLASGPGLPNGSVCQRYRTSLRLVSGGEMYFLQWDGSARKPIRTQPRLMY
jgi:hypothetical protein